MRRFVPFGLFLFVAPAGFALEAGRADGTLVVNGKSAKLAYAYAKRGQNPEGKLETHVLITSRVVPAHALREENEIFEMARRGQMEVIRIWIKGDRAGTFILNTRNVDSLNIGGSLVDHTVKVQPNRVEGNANATGKAFEIEYSFRFTFSAVINPGERYQSNEFADRELRSRTTSLPPGRASGELLVDGKTVRLTHAYAKREARRGGEQRSGTETMLILADRPLSAETVSSSLALRKLAQAQKVQYIVVLFDTFEGQLMAHTAELAHHALRETLPVRQWAYFDAYRFDGHQAEGSVYISEPHRVIDQKYIYTISFNAPVAEVADLSEQTIDSNTGTPLPADGGVPGQTYRAWSDAIQRGDLAAAKKLTASDHVAAYEDKNFLNLFPLYQQMRPRQIRVLGGFVSGTRATVHATGTRADFAEVPILVILQKEGANWRMVKESF